MIFIITLLSYKEYIIYDICFVYLCAIFKEQFSLLINKLILRSHWTLIIKQIT